MNFTVLGIQVIPTLEGKPTHSITLCFKTHIQVKHGLEWNILQDKNVNKTEKVYGWRLGLKSNGPDTNIVIYALT